MGLSKVHPVITGMGVISPLGIGIDEFTRSLKLEKINFSKLEFNQNGEKFLFPYGKVEDFKLVEVLAQIDLDPKIIQLAKRLRNISTSASYAVFSVLEAWANAGLQKGGIDAERVAIVSSGSNTQQASIRAIQDSYQEKLHFINPNYALNFFDTDIIGILSELLGIKGEGHSIGAASASGNMGIIQGCRLIINSEYDIVIVVAPLMDLSIYEFQGFTALGAMATLKEGVDPNKLCKPFDQEHSGFVYGQMSGCIILESEESASKRKKEIHSTITGYGVSMDANRNPNPSAEGELRAMLSALKMASVNAGQIDYINTHGTASKIGDQTEVEALISAGLRNAFANSTKSLIGHGLTAAGLVEVIASIIQMKEGFLHSTHNLLNPISKEINWVKGSSYPYNLRITMSNCLGFGGINTSLILKRN